jgi:hypothetical protein
VALANLGRYSEAFLALASAQAATKGEEAVARSRIPDTYGSLYADLELWDEALDRDYESLEVAGTIGGAAVKEPRIQSLLNLAEDHLALGAPDKAARQLAEIERMMPGAEYGRFRYENRLHFVNSLLASAREEWEPAVQFADECLSHAAIYGASKYEVRGRLARGQALWHLGQQQDGENELVAAAQRAEQLGFPTWARRSAGYLAKAETAVAQVAEHLDVDLRDRFLAQASRHLVRQGAYALRTCEVLVAYLTPAFHESRWTDQEVGWALGREVVIIPIQAGVVPYGFLAAYQAVLVGSVRSASTLADKVVRAIALAAFEGQRPRAVQLAPRVADALVDALCLSGSCDGMRRRLRSSAGDNSQVREAEIMPGSRKVPKAIEELIIDRETRRVRSR